MRTRVLIYSHDTFGLGNIRRMLAVAGALSAADQDTTVLVVSGSNALPAFDLPPRTDTLKLPALRRSLDGEYGVRALGMDYPALIELRANLILSAMLDFRPDIILVDKKPFGVGNELAKVLAVVARRVRQPRLLLLLRDILDAADVTREQWAKHGYHAAIEQYYDGILVAGDPQVFDLAQAYDFPRASRERLTYCGVIDKRPRRDRAAVRAALGVGDDKLVLVTPGGGEDGSHLVNAYLNTFAHAPLPGTRTLLVLGTEYNAHDARAVRARAAASGSMQCMDFTDDMPGHLAAADAVLCMGGYNTSYEAIGVGQRPIIVPRVRPVSEQLLRARALQRLGCAECLHPDALSPAELREAVTRALAAQPSGTESAAQCATRGNRSSLRFDGLDNIARAVLQAGRLQAGAA